MSKVIFGCEVWGDSYVSDYINYIYPNHLACLKQLKNVDYEYCLYTSVSDLPKIQSALSPESNTKVITRDKYGRYDNEVTQILTLQRAHDSNSSVFILGADSIYPINTFVNILHLSDTTDSIVYFSPWIRVNSSIRPSLNNCDNYSARSLVKLSLSYLHPKFTRHCMDEDNYNVNVINTTGWIPSVLYWKFGNSGILMRAFHMHPIFFKKALRPNVNDMGFHPLDQASYLSTYYSRKDIYTIDDSDISLIIDVDKDPPTPLPPLGSGTNPTKQWMGSWAEGCTHKALRELMKHNLYIHSEDITGEWDQIKLKVEKCTEEMYGNLLNRD